jgi:60 kDa SS-A/Ro ribonucleoprotein
VANAKYGKRRFAGCVLVSDTESWIYRDRLYAYGQQGATGVLDQWQQFVQNQPRLHGRDFTGPKLVRIDLQPYDSTQAPDRRDI